MTMTPLVTFPSPSREAEMTATCGELLSIGVVNNMPDAALHATERQLRRLIDLAAGNVHVHLKFFSFPEQPRTEKGKAHVRRYYEEFDSLWLGDFDGLIVTGTEPRSGPLTGEPYWRTLTKLVEWAEDRTTSTIWSCLAAHAAVLHLDGIHRQPLPKKLSGVFDCTRLMDHSIVARCPSRWQVPHSRSNDLPESDLATHDYSILSRSPQVGADIFVKQRQSLFVFMQGHLEYDPCSLLCEYRRDVARFLSGEKASYPDLPNGYFEQHVETTLSALARRATLDRNIDVLSCVPEPAKMRPASSWTMPAVQIYRNWLSYLADGKVDRLTRQLLASPTDATCGQLNGRRMIL
jgi:homoserine O-succinyltransferase